MMNASPMPLGTSLELGAHPAANLRPYMTYTTRSPKRTHILAQQKEVLIGDAGLEPATR